MRRPFHRAKSYASPWPVRLALPFPDESLLFFSFLVVVGAVDFNASVVERHCFAVYYLKMKRCNELREARGTFCRYRTDSEQGLLPFNMLPI